MRSWFIWNDIDSRSMNIVMEAAAPLQRAKERVKQVNILGRAGSLTLTEGDDVFESYIQSVSIAVKGEYNMRTILSWLRGEGWVSFSNDPDKRQKARIINALSFTKVSAHLDWYKGQVQFYCEPFKRNIKDDTINVVSSTAVNESGATVQQSTVFNNHGDASERPVITVSGLGTVTLLMDYADGTSGSFIVKNINGQQSGCVIDCDAMEVISLNGELMTGQSEGDFPVFPRGVNRISKTGSHTVKLTRAVRYL